MLEGTISIDSPPEDRRAALEYLRAKHPRFVYDSFSVECADNALRVHYRFRIEPDIEFTPETIFEQVDVSRVQSLPNGALQNLVFHLGLVEMLSYWKASCSPQVVVKAGRLDPEQIAWWRDLIEHGMGEFFFVNQIDFCDGNFVTIIPENQRAGNWEQGIGHSKQLTGNRKQRIGKREQTTANSLVLTSGGKDSVVTLELLREAGTRFDCLLLNPTEAAFAVARQALLRPGARPREAREHSVVGGQAGCPGEFVVVRRPIDPRLLELNAAGYLNGHTPFSALLAFLGMTVAVLCGFSQLIVSNERSAEEAAVEFRGHPVNHQYSKSLRFETAFRDYSQKYLTPFIPPIEYFSLLRPLYELQIAALFANYPQYFPLFRSCNRGAPTNSWCGHCPKCLFVFLILCPFLKREQLLGIFGEDLLAWPGAFDVLRALLGLDRDKPFECVGTKEETRAALYLCIEAYRNQGIELPPALQALEQTILSSHSDLPKLARGILTAWTFQHYIPSDLAELLRQKVTRG